MAEQIAAGEDAKPIYSDRNPCDAKHRCGNGWKFTGFRALSDHAGEYVPMQFQVRRHQHKSPIGCKHKQGSGKGRAAASGDKDKYMLGEHDAADHQSAASLMLFSCQGLSRKRQRQIEDLALSA